MLLYAIIMNNEYPKKKLNKSGPSDFSFCSSPKAAAARSKTDMQSAVGLVSLVDGKLVVPPEAEAVLSQIKEPLTVAAFCGRYRGGKSSLLSRLLGGSPDAFHVGHSVNACTKGIRFAPIPDVAVGGGRVLLLDTEGLCATDSDSTHDTRIFALSMLLSSTFFYNIVGTIDEASLSTLRVVIDFASMMVGEEEADGIGGDGVASKRQTKGCCPLDAMRDHMPAFHMLVRDMSLRLERLDGSRMSPDEWLESVLSPEVSPVNHALANADDKANVRSTIKRLFATRGCFTLPRPSGEEAVLAQMDSVDDTRLSPAFREGVAELKRRLLEAPPKRVCGEAVTGPGLLALTRHLVERINSGATPRIRDSWALLAELRAKEASGAALRHMHTVTAGWATSELSLDQLRRALGKASSEAIEMCIGSLPVGDAGDENERVLCHLKEVQLPERIDEVMMASKLHKEATCEATMTNQMEMDRILFQQLEICLAKATSTDGGFSPASVTALERAWEDVQVQLSKGEREYRNWHSAMGGWGGEKHTGYPMETASTLKVLFSTLLEAFGGLRPGEGRRLEELERELSASRELYRELERGYVTEKDILRREAEAELHQQVHEAREGGERLREELRQRCERLQVECNQSVKEAEVLRGEAVDARRRAEAAEHASLSMDEERAIEATTLHLAEAAELQRRLADAQHLTEALEGEVSSLRERVSTEGGRLSSALEETRRHAEGVIEERSREAEAKIEKAEGQAAIDRQQLQRVQREAQQASYKLSAQFDAAQGEASRLRACNEELKREERQARLAERKVSDGLRVEITALYREHQATLAQRESDWQRLLNEEQQRAGSLELQCARLDALNENGKREINRNNDLMDENKRLKATTTESIAVKTRAQMAQEAIQESATNRCKELEEARRLLQQERDRTLDLQCKLSVEQYKNGISGATKV